MNAFFAYISRMKHIKRWALMRNTMDESIQEHSHMVAVLAHALATIRNRYFGGNIDVGEVTAVALYHDAAEILTGDLPTPIKYYNPDIRDSYKEIERKAEKKLLRMMPQELQEDYRHLLSPHDEDILQIIKAADKLSAYIKCMEELKVGNREFSKAAVQTLASLHSCKLPELEFFMEKFLPSFSLTLDELE